MMMNIVNDRFIQYGRLAMIGLSCVLCSSDSTAVPVRLYMSIGFGVKASWCETLVRLSSLRSSSPAFFGSEIDPDVLVRGLFGSKLKLVGLRVINLHVFPLQLVVLTSLFKFSCLLLPLWLCLSLLFMNSDQQQLFLIIDLWSFSCL